MSATVLDNGTQELVETLKAVAYPSRLDIVLSLRDPKSIDEIKLEATGGPGSEDRCISREGVRHHLQKLREVGLLETLVDDGSSARKHAYRIRTPELYRLAETLRTLVRASGPAISGPRPPITWSASKVPTPSLVVVHGAEIGLTLSLAGKPTNPKRGWVVGSGPEADLVLDWDPHAEDQAAEVVEGQDGFELVDLRAASHRVSLDGEELGRGERRRLSPGSLVGVGSTLLCFRTP